jgi:NAD(P)-dependent dehydrogenase (short-subunit alcohol dehydrogenase family)
LSTGRADTTPASLADAVEASQLDHVQAGTGRRVCLLTGASGRLGTYFCNNFADRYDIVGVYRRNRPQLAAVDAHWFDPIDPDREIDANRRQVFLVQADLTDDKECSRVVELALARYDRIDLLVNGAVSSVWSSMLYSDHLRHSGYNQFVTNVLVPLNLSTVVARQFWQGRDLENRANNRNIVNVSSIAGLNLYTGSGQSLYAASKAALNQLTGHMADEFAAIGLRVNATAANSFPSIIPTSRAADAIVRLDRGAENGVIVVVDGETDTDVQLSPYQKTNQ